jgi:adenine phosphoribosyltransferase
MSRARNSVEINFVDGHADVWRLFDDPERLREIAEALVEPFRGEATKVAGIESRGFIVGTAAALALGVGFVPIRKPDGLFPGPKATAEANQDYRGNSHTLRMQRAALINDDRVLLVDDWIETGSQARAAKQLVESCGARLIGVATIVSEVNDTLSELGRVHALVTAEQLSGWTPTD